MSSSAAGPRTLQPTEVIEQVPTSLVIDTDTAGDDVFSLLVALRHPEAQLKAITVVCGNVAFDQQVENALYTVEMASRGGEVPVHPGCPRPLMVQRVGAENVHGADGMGDSWFPSARQRPEHEHAVDALVRLARENPADLTVVAHGPLTNIAAAVVRDPSFATNVRHLYVMGGTDNSLGNITPAAEYNFYVDPEAARIVLEAGFRLTLCTWTLTLACGIFDDERLARIEGIDSELSRFFMQVNRRNLEFCRADGLPGSTHPDSLTCAIALDERLVTGSADRFVAVETKGELTRGYSLVDRDGILGHTSNVRVVEAADGERFHEMMLAVLR